MHNQFVLIQRAARFLAEVLEYLDSQEYKVHPHIGKSIGNQKQNLI